MTEANITRLNPTKVVVFHAISKSPENEALNKMLAWAKPIGLLDEPDKYKVFGFDNPCPCGPGKDYGYEVWVTVDEDFETMEDLTIKHVPGGTYAVTEVRDVKNPWEEIPKAWKDLREWVKKSKYRATCDQWLEHHLPPFDDTVETFSLALYLPVEEK